MTSSDYQKEIELLLNNGGREEYAKNLEYALGSHLVSICLMAKVIVKPQQPNEVNTTKGTNSSKVKIQVILSGKEL